MVQQSIAKRRGRKIKEVKEFMSHEGTQTEEAAKNPTPVYRKRTREPTMSPSETNATRPMIKTLSTRGKLALNRLCGVEQRAGRKTTSFRTPLGRMGVL